MFNLSFISDETFSSNRSELVLTGQITLGSFTEKFESSLSFWTRLDYEKHWITAAKRLTSCSNAVFITDLGDPDSTLILTWWPAWKIGRKVFVQNHLLFLNQLAEPFDVANPNKSIAERMTVNEDGEKISEWEISIRGIEKFVQPNE